MDRPPTRPAPRTVDGVTADGESVDVDPARDAWTAHRLALLALTGLALYLCWLVARPFVASLAWRNARLATIN